MFILAEQAAQTAAETTDKIVLADEFGGGIGLIDYYAIGAYMLVMVAIGVICRNMSKDVSDYIRMGGRSSWWLAGLSVFMASFSAATFTGYAGQAYLAGWSIMIHYWIVAAGFFIQAAIFAPWMRNTRAVTPPDAIRLRFGGTIEQIFVYFGLLGSFVWSGVFLWTLATFTATVFGWPIEPVIIVVGIVLIFYSVSGGSWSVQITDSLQSFLVIPITLVMAWLAIRSVGGIDGLFNEIEVQGLTEEFSPIKATDHEYATHASKVKPMLYTYPWLWASLIGIVFAAANMTGCYRYLSIKTGSDARKAAILAGTLTFFGSFIWIIPAMVARLKFSTEVEALIESGIKYPADSAYAIVAMKILPAGLLGLVVVAMFSATMSSMDSNLTGTAGLLAKNLYVPLARFLGFKPLEGRALMRLTKFINLLLGIWAILVALMFTWWGYGYGIFGAMIEIIAMIGTPLGMPFVVSFLMRKIPAWAPVAGMIVGFIASASLYFKGDYIATEWLGRDPAIIYFHERALTVAFFSLVPAALTRFFWFTAGPDFRERVDYFFKLMKTPVDVDKEVGGSIDHSHLTTVGGLGMITSLIVFPLLFTAKDNAGRLAVAFVFLFIFGISTLMYVKGRIMTKKLNGQSDEEKTLEEPPIDL